MRQSREGHVRAFPGEFRDPSLFRGHGIRSRCTWHVSLPRFVKWRPLPSPGSLGSVPLVPRYSETLRPPDSLLAALRCLRLAIPLERLSFVPVRLQTQSRRIIPEFAVPVTPEPADFRELSGSPKFPGNPVDHSPCSPTPAGPSTRCGTRGQRTRHGPRTKAKRGLLTGKVSGLNHTAFGLAVYASW